MSSQKTNNNDSCRDLSGRRLSTIKEAKKYVHFSPLIRALPSFNGCPPRVVIQVAGKKHRFDDNEYLEQSRELVDNVRSAVTAGQFSCFYFLFFFFLHRDPSILSFTHTHRLVGLRKKRKKAKIDQSLPKPSSHQGQQEAAQAPSTVLKHRSEELSVVNSAAVGA